jgi:hypothetical protein
MLLTCWQLFQPSAQMDCNLTILFCSFGIASKRWRAMHQGIPLGFNSNRQFGPIKVVQAGGGGDQLSNIDAIVVGDDNAEDLDLESRFSG